MARSGKRLRSRQRASLTTVATGLIAGWAMVPATSVAATFDETSRKMVLDDAAVALSLDSFESLPAGVRIAAWRRDESQLGDDELRERFIADAGALEGTGGFDFGGDVVWMYLVLGDRPELAGRRIEVRVWQKSAGARAGLALLWYAGDDEAQEFLGQVIFWPTGRATNDGYEEWSSGPVDYLAGGLIPLSYITIGDVEGTSGYAGQTIEPSVTARARLDAVEVYDLGPAAVPDATCRLIDESERCGPEGLCLFGRCTDAALVAGSVPQDPAVRSDYVARRAFEFGTFEGGRLPQRRSEALATAFASLTTDNSAVRFWPTISREIAALRDGHASPPYPTYPAYASAGVCFHLGEADLLPGGGALPLVFSIESDNPIANALQVGDALVAIDGLPPAEWATRAGRLVSYGGDPRGAEVVTAPSLLGAALVSGATLTVARCPREAQSAVPCTAAEVTTIQIDLARELGDAVWSGPSPEWRWESVPCDYRFLRALDDEEVRNYEYAGWADNDGVRTLIINGVPDYRGYGGADWQEAVEGALSPAPELLILDERIGMGGSISTTDLIAAMLVGGADYGSMDVVPSLYQEIDATLLASLKGCYAGLSAWRLDYEPCGGYFPWSLGEMSRVDQGVAAESKLAILMASDISGNDYLTRLLTYRSGPTRIFGAGATWGAFGPIYTLPPHALELMGGSFQAYDTLFDEDLSFATGVGVTPDVVVLQKQSDALNGVDTVIAAARTWLQGD